MDILHDFMLKFESVFTLPAFGKFVKLLQGFMQTHAPKALTELKSHLPQDSHFCGVYDFLNRYAWSHLDLAQRLLDWYVETLLQRQRFLLVVDELLPLGTPRYSSVTQGKWKVFAGIQSITVESKPKRQLKLARKSQRQVSWAKKGSHAVSICTAPLSPTTGAYLGSLGRIASP